MDRRDLIAALQDVGFTYRDSRKIVSAIIETMTKTLKENKKLDLTFGTLSLSTRKPLRRYRLSKIVRLYTKPRAIFQEKK